MTGMSSSFSTDTRVTLWFPEWTTTTPAAYAFTLIFLFSLGIFNRFLAALRAQLDRRWKTEVNSAAQQSATAAYGDEDDARRLLTPALSGQEDEQNEKYKETNRSFWVPVAPFSVKRDGVRALLEFTRVLIAYVLYVGLLFCFTHD
jgi:hypothetical protein